MMTTAFSAEENCWGTSWSVETLFDLLGLTYAKGGKKYMPFDEKFRMLGLEVNLSHCKNGKVTSGHTNERQDELVARINDILAEGWMDAKEAERLRGRMIFFEGYTFDRLANAAIKNVGRFCAESSGRKRLDASIRSSLLLLRDRVLSAPPISIGRPLRDTWIIFTDGACNPEQRSGSVGGLIISPFGTCLSFFSSMVLTGITDELFKLSCNPIHELEVLPVFIACLEWGDRFDESLVVYYIDNESPRMAYVRGSGETHFATHLINDFVKLESQRQHKTWFGRCPSYSNPSDEASRLNLEWFKDKGASQTNLNWERLKHHLGLDGETADRR